ncbi:MAG: GNAT family N-acetyltransferase [Eubacteriales bacterium]|nr:GNAT family N-acetyltransferase [Eubacteriales bacterium]
MNYIIRKIKKEEYKLLDDFLYEAIFIPEGIEPPPRNIIRQPELQVYVSEFGKKDDLCLVAEAGGTVVGAVWTRIMDDYGHVDNETPSLAISILKGYRGCGIGTALMTDILELLRENGYRKVSLSVQKENYAYKLYLKVGFTIAEEKEEEYIMICPL